MMRECANKTGLPIYIYGPETHITAIVPLALGLAKLSDFPEFDDDHHQYKPMSRKESNMDISLALHPESEHVAVHQEADHKVENFTAMTRCVVYGLQHRAVQGMLDFDYMCKRAKPSVAAMIFPFSSNHHKLLVRSSTKSIAQAKAR